MGISLGFSLTTRWASYVGDEGQAGSELPAMSGTSLKAVPRNEVWEAGDALEGRRQAVTGTQRSI